MTNHEYEILNHIRKNHPVRWGDILNAFNPQTRINETHAILHAFLSAGMIEKTWWRDRPPRCWIRLTGRGVAALDEATLNHSSMDSQQCKTEISKKGRINSGSIFKFLRNIISLIKVLLEILRLLPL